MFDQLYWYCTDFCINAANLMGLTYNEFNFLLFIVVFPMIFLLLVLVNVWRYVLIPLKQRMSG